MTKEEFDSKIRELLPRSSATAMDMWIGYAEDLEMDELIDSARFFNSVYVELRLVSEHQGADTATALFNYGEHFTLNPFEIRGAARLYASGMSMEQIESRVLMDGCDPTPEEARESKAALSAFEAGQSEQLTGQQLY